jgi:hypothetical protein
VAVTARDDGRDRTTTGIQPPTSRPVTTPSPSTMASTVPSAVPSGTGSGGDGDTSSLTLRGDGLGPVDFGAPMDQTIAAVATHLGEVARPLPRAGTPCPGDQWVEAGWDTFATVVWQGLSLVFAGPDASSLHFVGWFALDFDGPVNLATVEGPRVGDPVAVWRAAYGSRVVEFPEVPGMFRVALPEGEIVVNHSEVGGDASAGTLCVPDP